MLSPFRQVTHTRSTSHRLTARTGNHCPLSGLWAPYDDESAPTRVLEGSIMPTYGNEAVEWKLMEPFKGFPRHGLQA